MDLISKKALLSDLCEDREEGTFCFTDSQAEAADKIIVYVTKRINAQPPVPAVPLDKLCEWLNVHCGRPNYCNDRLCGECNLDGEGYEYETCWKTLLTEWMEEQDAAD